MTSSDKNDSLAKRDGSAFGSSIIGPDLLIANSY